MDNDLIHTISGNDVILAYGGRRRKSSYKEYRGDQRACTCMFMCRYCLFFINCVVWASGVGMIAVGALALDRGAGLELLSDQLDQPCWLLIGSGIVSVVVGIYGCIVSVKINTWCLRAFMVVTVGLFILLVVLGSSGFFLIDSINDEMSEKSQKAIINYGLGTHTEQDEALNDLQKEYGCCGGHSFSDWEANVLYSCNARVAPYSCGVPQTCCRGEAADTDPDCGQGVRTATEQYTEMFAYTEGCIAAVLRDLKDHVALVAALSFTVCTLQIVCLILANIIIKNTVYHRKLLR